MATLRLKHNPSHMPEDELIRSFVVRQRDLAAILETVRENTGSSNQHLLILGPRGMGKTTLVNRAVAEIRRDPALNKRWYPILFDEESYTVTSAGELWFQALSHLADQTQDREIERARRALQPITDRDRLRDASLARLLEFADAQHKRLLLVFENVDMIFDDQLTEDDAWDVRHTLQNEPRIAVLATSTTPLDAFHDSDKPLYELFREHTLERLDLEECRTVWRLVTGAELPPNQARPIQIFTGGNTRLLTILATFAKDRSFRELMDDLVGLIDENTPYFKHNVEALPKESRKIFVTLAELWSPATARQVADHTRGDVRAVSAQLGRLQQQGIIEVAKRVDKTMMYQVAERMYNLYHLLRRRGSARVQAVVEFIVRYYDQDGMQRLLASMATEACDLDGDRREDHVRAYVELLRRLPDQQQRDNILGHAPAQFLELPDIVRFLQELTPKSDESPPLTESELRAPESNPHDVDLAYRLGKALSDLARWSEAEEVLRRLVIDMHADHALCDFVMSLLQQDKLEEARSFTQQRVAASPFSAAHVAASMVSAVDGDIGRERYHLEQAAKLPCTDLTASGLLMMGLLNLNDVPGARRAALQFIAAESDRPKSLSLISGLIITSAFEPLYPFIVEWAQELAATKAFTTPGNILLARALGRMNAWDQVWSPLQIVLSDASFAQDNLRDIVELLSLAAARGHASQAYNILMASPSASRLEPLAVALARIVGEPTNPPQEVSEVADDIVRDIEKLRAALARKPAAPRPKQPSPEHRQHRRATKNSRSTKPTVPPKGRPRSPTKRA